MTTPIKVLCERATKGPRYQVPEIGPPALKCFEVSSHESSLWIAYAQRKEDAELIARLSPEVVLAVVAYIERTPMAHVLNPNDAGEPCRCSQCERWHESRRLLLLLNGQTEALE